MAQIAQVKEALAGAQKPAAEKPEEVRARYDQWLKAANSQRAENVKLHTAAETLFGPSRFASAHNGDPVEEPPVLNTSSTSVT